MDALEMSLLYDYYGGLLTDKQRQCFDMRHNQDLSLGEIAEELGVSRQAVCDNLNRTEALLRRMEDKVGYVGKDLKLRRALASIKDHTAVLRGNSNQEVSDLAERILSALQTIEE